MNNEKIMVVGTNKKFTSADILLLVGSVIIFLSFFIAAAINSEIFRDLSFIEFYFSKFYHRFYYHGTICTVGIIVIVLGLIVYKINGKSKITVTNKRIFGTIKKKDVDIPINQIIEVKRKSSDGVYVFAGEVYDFSCLKNREDVIKAILYAVRTSKDEEDDSSDVERVMRLKNLYNAGVITLEEFDGKKKEILF